MAIRRSLSERAFQACNVAFMALLMLVTLYPIWHVAMASISVPEVVANKRGLILWPQGGFSLETYQTCLKHPALLISYRNTLLYVLLGTAINLVLTLLTAYVLSRRNLMLKPALLAFMMFTMYFGGGLIPTYLLINNLGMLNTIWAMVIPNAINITNVIITRTYFMGLPDSLEESARIDGANEWTILFRIVLPLSAPIIAVISLYYGVGHWNSWFDAMIYLRNRELYPLALILREIVINGDVTNIQEEIDVYEWKATTETVKYGTIMIATIPIMCVYPFLQKYFAKGVMIGALKG
jgi:putative aldouronate transport system permease protein